MIRINLLKDLFVHSGAKGGKNEQSEVVSEVRSSPKSTLPVVGILFCLIFSGIGGLYYFWLNKQIADQEERSAALTAEKQALEPYFKLEEQFRKQKEELQKKEQVLTRLKKQQQLPVYFLHELGNSLPDNVWFVKVSTKGQKVEIRGESLTEDAIYHFRNNLVAKSQWFRNVNFSGANRKDKKLEFTLTFDLMNPA
ncbi:MAG: PilN domain-containing protein [Holophagales bacterium]|jgi:type IV pilus assembly protein PilN|nr:PilN domain-containing protein [Holophagales bacterium]